MKDPDEDIFSNSLPRSSPVQWQSPAESTTEAGDSGRSCPDLESVGEPTGDSDAANKSVPKPSAPTVSRLVHVVLYHEPSGNSYILCTDNCMARGCQACID